MIVVRYVVREVEEVADVLCNRCGKSCRVADEGDIFECATLQAGWGYGSLKDGERLEAHLCESCCDEITRNFAIPPTADEE